MRNLEIKNEVNLEIYVTNILHNLGVPAHLKGYHYVREAIMMSVKDDTAVFNITKAMYPTLARKFDTTGSRVERAIRHAIETSWSRADRSLLDKMFSCTVDPEKGKPTNAEYIALIADKVKLEQDNWNK